ncbi:MAG: hypothetical protein R3A10_06025 [Caldilineaceae bacterium]
MSLLVIGFVAWLHCHAHRPGPRLDLRLCGRDGRRRITFITNLFNVIPSFVLLILISFSIGQISAAPSPSQW